MQTIWFGGAEWPAVLRVGLGLWWPESWRYKDKKAWFERGTGIAWAGDVAGKHRWSVVRSGFDTVVRPRPKVMANLAVYAGLALGPGLVLGFLAPIARVAGLVLNLLSRVLMIHDRAEQGPNAMMALISLISLISLVSLVALVALFAMSRQTWSLDDVVGVFS